ncbi:MAG: hypothetical protein OEV66_03275 [Spirochaetia bacterium]|nr:hypothetical protein [Spirochaetia bacterium]
MDRDSTHGFSQDSDNIKEMKKIYNGIFLFIWIAFGLSFGWLFYQQKISTSIGDLQKKIVQIEVGHNDTHQLFDKLPQVFNNFPSACAILVLNQKGKLLGSLFEPSRISRTDYEKLIRSYKTIELKNYQYFRLPFAATFSIWIIAKKQNNPFEIYAFFLENNPGFILVPVFYFFILLISGVAFFLRPKHTSNAMDNIPEDHGNVESGAIQTERFLSNKIILLMDAIENNFSTRNIAFYSREGGAWKHVFEKSGNLTVRGDAAIENLPSEILNLTEDTWREPLISHEGRLMFIPLHYRNVLFGLLRLQFSGLASQLTSEFLEKLISLTSRYAHSLFMQRIYDRAVADPETDYYNYPYFYFLLREKISHAASFAVVVFEISHLNRVSPESVRNWSQDVVSNLAKSHLKPSMSVRLERTKFAFLYETGDHGSAKNNLPQLENIPDIIKKTTQTSFKALVHVTGGFFLKPSSFEDADTFMQKLDYLLINSTFSPFSPDFNMGEFSDNKNPVAI